MLTSKRAVITQRFSEIHWVKSLKSPLASQNGAAEFEYNGLDYVLRGRFETGYGDFNLSFNASQYLEYSYELTYGTGEMGDAVGDLGFPEWRSNAYVNWNLNNWSANLAVDYIGGIERTDR